jgi:hypothetical protein
MILESILEPPELVGFTGVAIEVLCGIQFHAHSGLTVPVNKSMWHKRRNCH